MCFAVLLQWQPTFQADYRYFPLPELGLGSFCVTIIDIYIVSRSWELQKISIFYNRYLLESTVSQYVTTVSSCFSWDIYVGWQSPLFQKCSHRLIDTAAISLGIRMIKYCVREMLNWIDFSRILRSMLQVCLFIKR